MYGVAEAFDKLGYTEAVQRLDQAQTAYGTINSVHDLITHPQFRTRPMRVHGRTVEVPATPYISEWDQDHYRPVPQVGEHTTLHCS
jgi:itaconate CoA-transferase